MTAEHADSYVRTEMTPMDRRTGFSPTQLEELAALISAHRLSDAQIEQITTNAAKKAVEMMTRDAYAAVGKTVVQKVLKTIGLLTVALGLYALNKGWIKL